MSPLVELDGGEIVIRVPIDAIPAAAAVAFDNHYGFEQHKIEVVDGDTFAIELLHELRKEAEDGSTLVHRMLDRACVLCAEAGAFGLNDA
ncbi:hypothetical protein [Sphingomonas hankookensis]|uniref:hypothetical protein n=1 Tax=Sphingomonas hankookensis TaxID=563996 RepID=UPI003D30373E